MRREGVLLRPSINGFTETRLEDGGIGVLVWGITNSGMGPAKIVGFRPLFGDKPHTLNGLIDAAVGDKFHQRAKVSTPAIGTSLAAQETFIIGIVKCKANNQDELDQFGDLFEGTTVEVKYKSFIEDEVYTFLLGGEEDV